MRPTAAPAALAIWALSSLAFAAQDAWWKAGDAPDTLLVTFQSPLSDLQARAREALQAGLGAQVDLEIPSIHVQRLRLAPGSGEAGVNAALKAYRDSGLVRAAQPDFPAHPASLTVDDPLYTSPTASQWYLTATAWPQAVAAYNAGSFSLPGSVVVAVIDSGVAPSADLAGQLLPAVNFASGSPGTSDDFGHGTFCAGLIAAVGGNGIGMAGAFIEPGKVKILPLRVFGGCGTGYVSDIAAAIVYAAQQGARVLNLSLAIGGDSSAVENAIAQARVGGALVVAAAGNDGGAGTSYPAAYPNAMAVGALDHADGKAFYGNQGKLEISAPGGDGIYPPQTCATSSSACCPYGIWSLEDDHPGCPAQSNFACSIPDGSIPVAVNAGSGTSFSTPLVSAAAAMLFSQDPGRSVEDVERILEQSASPTALGPGFHAETGWGKLNYAAALASQSVAPGGSAMKAYNWPNPFRPDRDRVTTFTFFLPEGRPTKLRLLDAGGDLVKQWDLPSANPGMNFQVWDGRNGVGDAVAVGAYTLVVESGGRRVLAQVAVLR